MSYIPESNQESDTLQPKNQIKADFKGLFKGVYFFLKELLDIKADTDAENTKASIRADIAFKGHTSWILICSIFIASIGLNANSTAVVIGAMLISPLMGPILGIGMSLAINDLDLLNRSIKNFLVMVGLSVFTAFLFFALFPLRDESSELLARVKPDIRDVLIAFFGGLALVIARAKKGTVASVIFGVAIATALMPPLCTVGFGLAVGKWNYAYGALYLFIINTMFIALATYLVIKYLRFPMVRYANSQRRRFIARVVSIMGFIVIIPAGITFYSVLQESLFRRDAQTFLSETIEIYQFNQNGIYRKELTELKYDQKEGSEIAVVVIGDETIPQSVINTWTVQKNQYDRLQDASLEVFQGAENDNGNEMQYVLELYESKKNELLSKENQISVLEQEVARLSSIKREDFPFEQLKLELKSGFPEIVSLNYSNKITTDFRTQDTIPFLEVRWNSALDTFQVSDLSLRLQNWIRVRLADQKIVVKAIS